MKKILITIFSLFAFTFAQANTTAETLLKNVLLKNTNLLIKNINLLEKNLNEKNFNISSTRESFKELIYSWKKVQATYIGGDLDSNLLDTPRYIDIFHEGNENIHEQLKRVRASKDSLDIELFKNSYKTINALEYILYADSKMSKRDIEIAKRIVTNLKAHFLDIENIYKNKNKKLLEDEKFANSSILNALIANSYKTYEWRVGEGLGKTRKYKNQDSKRFEYNFSKQSVIALKGIIDAHIEILDGEYEDFGDMAIKSGAKEEIKILRELLKNTKNLLKDMSDSDLVSKKGEILYSNLKEIYINYGLYLLDALEVTAKIIEADGD